MFFFQEKVPAAVFVGNGFGKLAGSTQVTELGNIEIPIILTNTLNVSRPGSRYTVRFYSGFKVKGASFDRSDYFSKLVTI
ncbi:P1 family peptidase [uncultured Sphingobacterium sp.]|uniref:P1 family peptidase n=1 Tax=uncultured Sphingobacterium sp. TaxID=182688 RepID=UPI0037492D27